MAEDFGAEQGQDRTEAPTQRRREEARRRGDVALSTDLSGGLLLLAGLLVLWLAGAAIAQSLLANVRHGLKTCTQHDLSVEGIESLFLDQLGRGAEPVGMLLGVLFVVGVAAALLQVGFGFSTERLAWNWERLSVAGGFRRMFSLGGVLRGFLALVKVAVVLLAAWLVLRGRAEQIAALGSGPLSRSVAESWSLIIRLGLVLAGSLVVLGAADFLVRRLKLERSLMMTRQELKEEIKREEGDPAFKNRIRQLQRQAAQRRMLDDVPRSSVVITNPTHLAVALLFDRTTMAAPRVLAKGSGVIARRIVEKARRHSVPVLERKPLARGLFRAVQVGEEIPAALFQAVAEVLAFVYRARGSLPGSSQAI